MTTCKSGKNTRTNRTPVFSPVVVWKIGNQVLLLVLGPYGTSVPQQAGLTLAMHPGPLTDFPEGPWPGILANVLQAVEA
eukprot:2753309-Amphidinium_carterae.1